MIIMVGMMIMKKVMVMMMMRVTSYDGDNYEGMMAVAMTMITRMLTVLH